MSSGRPADLAGVSHEADAVLQWLSERDFAGVDPFDGLESRLFGATPLASWRLARLGWTQVFKRLPVNLRPLAGVAPARNAKAVGLVLTALARRAAARGALETAVGDALVDWLGGAKCPGSSGWGYPFAWQSRAFYAPKGTPNAVCTAFVVSGLLDYAEAGGGASAAGLAASAAPFFLGELKRTPSAEGFCFSYTPLDATRVHNVNLLVAAALARLDGGADSGWLAPAAEAAAYSVAAQREDGAWVYGDDPGQGWVDGFHTGFNLGALRRLHAVLGTEAIRDARARGYAYFRRHLVEPDGTPRYYDRSRWPLDVHSAAQAIVTLVEARDLDAEAVELAVRVATFARRVLGRGEGTYVYQRGRLLSKRIVYARWGQAWMLRGLSELEAALVVGR